MAVVKIKLTQGMAGKDYTYQAGQVIEVEKKEAQRLLDANFAIPYQESCKKATAKPPTNKRTKKK